MADFIGNLIEAFKTNLISWGYGLGVVLLFLGALSFGLSRAGPTEMRARMATYSTNLFLGGTVILIGLAVIPGLAKILSGQG